MRPTVFAHLVRSTSASAAKWHSPRSKQSRRPPLKTPRGVLRNMRCDLHLLAGLDEFLCVAAAVVVLIVTILAHKALVPRPRLDQRAVYVEVLARGQGPLLTEVHDFVEKFDH